MTALAAEELKACCADAYASAAARFLLGDSFHPGGAELTSLLGRSLEVGPASSVVDVACGRGVSAVQLVQELGCAVVGVDLSEENVAAAAQLATQGGVGGRARFLRGDAEALPLDDESADGALCECALCTFPDKAAAAAEIARVLRPGARVALSDVTAVPERLPPELTTVQAWVACVADARPLEQIGALLEASGLSVEVSTRRDEALTAMLERIDGRLAVVGMLELASVERGRELVAAARSALADGALGYGSLVARKSS